MDQQVRDIADRYLKNVRPSGTTDLRSLCPFHRGKVNDRSFCISLRTGAWICFSDDCRASGSVVQLLQRLGLSDRLVDRFAQQANARPSLPMKLRRKLTVQENWTVLPEFILGSYKGAPEALLQKGFSQEVLEAFEVGFDRNNDRIIFPIRDHLGRLVAVSGRATSKSAFPRYKVYDAKPPRPPRQKAGEFYGVVENYTPNNRRHLYGIHRVYPERYYRKSESVQPLVVTEGYKSTLWLHQLGFTHTLGLQGSSLTPAQQRTLSRMRGPIYVMLDNEPGKQYPDRKRRCAALKIAKQLRSSGLVLLCRYPDKKPPGTQPDSLTLKEVQAAIERAETPSIFTMRKINNEHG